MIQKTILIVLCSVVAVCMYWAFGSGWGSWAFMAEMESWVFRVGFLIMFGLIIVGVICN